MQHIRSDINRLLTPTWMPSVPSNLGEAAHGKLKADVWRTLGTIHLPLSLIALWHKPVDGNPRSLRCVKILSVTLSLLSAVIIASSHVTSPAHAKGYLDCMTRYITGIKELFPEYSLVPNHHMAMHIAEYLRLFGPVHSWWTFPSND
ncbi:hypothetical protein BJ912DRAFT_864584 [Pholiota molesta]|nr:hypothetical protein BJ912DRAFT_864584 [Pholiota molesta]